MVQSFMAGCVIANRFSLGPVFILISLILVMVGFKDSKGVVQSYTGLSCVDVLQVTNLGRRRDGELSSYSIFNPGELRFRVANKNWVFLDACSSFGVLPLDCCAIDSSLGAIEHCPTLSTLFSSGAGTCIEHLLARCSHHLSPPLLLTSG